ncbi:MAG: alanine racemase, partial [Peptococcaceae bacterium]|nr:alanine racemase [Peptococcaceae bacterium]
MNEMSPSWAEINLAALENNYLRTQAYTNSELMPIVKADAYGHGAVEVVGVLRACGARRFGVAHVAEALELQAAFPDVSVMLIGYT